MSKPKSVCVKCGLELSITKNGNPVVLMFNEPKQPYEVWFGDLWTCPGCGGQIVSGFANVPFAEHWQPDFQKKLEYVSGEAVYCSERTAKGERT